MISIIPIILVFTSDAKNNFVSKFEVNELFQIQGKIHFLKGVEKNGRGNIILDGPTHQWTRNWTRCNRLTQIKVYMKIYCIYNHTILKIKQYLESICEIEKVMFRRRLYSPVKRQRFL